MKLLNVIAAYKLHLNIFLQMLLNILPSPKLDFKGLQFENQSLNGSIIY